MPYKIEERDGRFCVVNDEGGVEKCHDERADADAHLKALYAADEEKSFSMLGQTTVNYVTLSATPGQACANCRWFQSFGDQWTPHPRCHLVMDYPEPIEPTGRCDRWEEGKYEPAQMTPMPVVIVEGEAAAGKQQRRLMQRLRDLLPKRKQFATGLKVVGNHWVITWSNNFEDRDGEIFTQKSIDRYVARVDMGVVPTPEWWVWHTSGKTRIGQASWVGRHNHFIIAAGEFDDTPQAHAAKAYYQKHAHETGVSHGFTFPVEKFDGKHYHEFNTFEVSTLPRGAEANRFTSLEGVKHMALDEKKRTYLEQVFGKEQAEKILEDLDTRGKALEDIGVAFKDFVNATDDDGSAAKDAVAKVERDLKAFIGDLIADNAAMAEQLAASGKAYTALDTRTKASEAALAALKEVFDLKPRTASEDKDTEITNEQVVTEVAQQFAQTDKFWGTKVDATP